MTATATAPRCQVEFHEKQSISPRKAVLVMIDGEPVGWIMEATDNSFDFGLTRIGREAMGDRFENGAYRPGLGDVATLREIKETVTRYANGE